MNALLQIAPDEASRIQSNLNPDKIGAEVRNSYSG
jgi:hypothetical protein